MGLDRLELVFEDAFISCSSLTYITIPSSVTFIATGAFDYCSSLEGMYFEGNAPGLAQFFGNNATVYYLPGTSGWTSTFGGCPTAL